MARLIVSILVLVLVCLVPQGWSQTQRVVITAASERMMDLQADITADNAGNGFDPFEIPDDPDDGGWDFTIPLGQQHHTTADSPTNIYGTCALGMVFGFPKNDNPARTLIGLIDGYIGMLADPTINSGLDAGYLARLTRITGDTTYRTFARLNWYSTLAEIGGDPGDPRATAEAIRDARDAQGFPALYPWDCALLVCSAVVLEKEFRNNEFKPQALAIANVVAEDLTSGTPIFDRTDANQMFYQLGLNGAAIALKGTGTLPSLAVEVRNIILARQLGNGAWGFSDQFPTAAYQETAYAIIALFTFRNHQPSKDARADGSTFLASTQLASGGWDFYLDGTTEVPTANGENILAIALVRPNPALGPIQTVPRPREIPVARPFRINSSQR